MDPQPPAALTAHVEQEVVAVKMLAATVHVLVFMARHYDEASRDPTLTLDEARAFRQYAHDRLLSAGLPQSMATPSQPQDRHPALTGRSGSPSDAPRAASGPRFRPAALRPGSGPVGRTPP